MRSIPTLLALVLVACGGSGGDSAVAPLTGGTAPAAAPPELPGYSGKSCPKLKAGSNTIDSDGLDRDVEIYLPSKRKGAPVVFAWHYLGGTPTEFVTYFGIDDWVDEHGVVVIAPRSRGLAMVEWDTYAPQGSADLQLFDDLLNCAWENFEIDADRVYSIGHSAGALWTVSLTNHKSKWLAASAPVSGGATEFSWDPKDPIPMLITWGGPSDMYGDFSFDDATDDLFGQLDSAGQFAVACEHSSGHNPPPGGMDYAWEFFDAHPKHINPEPWASGLPGSMPAMCSID